MTSQRRAKKQTDKESDWWLWPSALLLAMGGWGQAAWMWENTLPEGIAPLWLLLWTGVGVAGLSLPLYWLSRHWWPVAWLATGAWAAVPYVKAMARQRSLSPLLLLLLLGVGLGGLMIGVSRYVARRWSGSSPNIRPLREGFWSGLFAVICGWLLINRAFSLTSVALLAGALVLLEIFLVMRESSRKQASERRA